MKRRRESKNHDTRPNREAQSRRQNPTKAKKWSTTLLLLKGVLLVVKCWLRACGCAFESNVQMHKSESNINISFQLEHILKRLIFIFKTKKNQQQQQEKKIVLK